MNSLSDKNKINNETALTKYNGKFISKISTLYTKLHIHVKYVGFFLKKSKFNLKDIGMLHTWYDLNDDIGYLIYAID